MEEEGSEIYKSLDEQLSREDSPTILSFIKEEFSDAPLPLISLAHNNSKYYTEFTLHPETLDFLKTIEAPIAVVAVAGLYRTGKSYLLNRVLLERTDGFGVGPTVNPCTKGLWIWGRPIPGKLKDGTDCNILIVDSEGIGALDADSSHDTRIFALALLISSYFIYNSVGSIDETALQNLSLVANLTKHIQIKSNGSDSYEDFGQYFPQFLWVVRDFTLQLVDETGQSITEQQYLERALQIQKGFSDATEERNRIRKMLTNFFPKRDCCTLVRPVKNEQDLQNLCNIQMSELRPEFVEKIHVMREKVLFNAAGKSLNGKMLTGEILANMMSAYVDSMNNGSVPTIENAWSYICKNECSKAIHEAEDVYEREMLNLIDEKFPIDDDELKQLNRQAFNMAIACFNKKAIGNDKHISLDKLREILKEKYRALKKDNIYETEQICRQFLTDNYELIQNRINAGDFSSWTSYLAELRKFQHFFREHGPRGPYAREYMLEFCLGCVYSATDYFLKAFTLEIRTQQEITESKVVALETELRDCKESYMIEKGNLHSRLTEAETSRAELHAREISMKEQLQAMRLEREKMEKELRDMARENHKNYSKQIEEAQNTAWQTEEKMKEMERKLYQVEAEKVQEKALLEQKLGFLETTLEEVTKKDKDGQIELKNVKREYMQSIKEMQAKYESQIRNYQLKLEQECDRVADLEKALAEKETIIETHSYRYEEIEVNYKAILSQTNTEIESLKASIGQREAQYKREVDKVTQQFEGAVNRLKARLSETEKRLKQSEDLLKNDQASWEKDNAVLLQKIEFLEQELIETKDTLEKERRQHETMLKALQANEHEVSKNELETAMNKLKEYHLDEYNKLESDYESYKYETTAIINSLKENTASMEMNYKIRQNEWQTREEELNKQLQTIQDERDRLSDLIYCQNSLNLEESEARYRLRIHELEEELENIHSNHDQELNQIRSDSELTISQLKKFYEKEKSILEQRLIEEKERVDKKYILMCEEYEARLKEDQEQLEDEIAALQEELHLSETSHSQELQQLKNQSALDQQKIETLEKYLAEIKENYSSLQKSNSNSMEQYFDNFNKERNSLLEKIEKLSTDLTCKERELSSANYYKTQLESMTNSRERDLEDLRTHYLKEKSTLMDRLEASKQLNQKLADELSQKKSDYKRELALANQHIEFQAKKLAELDEALQEVTSKYNEVMKSGKSDTGLDFPTLVEKLSIEKESLEQKLEQKKQALRELELRTFKQVNSLEKEKEQLREKLQSSEIKRQEAEEKYNQEIEEYRRMLDDSKIHDMYGSESIQDELETTKNRLNELEKELTQKRSTYERDKTLWENKFNFLVQQRDQARQDLNEAQKKFEIAMEKMQKKGVMDKEKIETTTATLMATIENRFSVQLKEAQESNQQTLQALTERCRKQEREIRDLREELELERQKKSGGAVKSQETQEAEMKLITEIDALRKEKEARLKEIQSQFNSERDQLKGKIIENEKRARDAEFHKGQLFLEHEKERAKWALERDHLISQRNEAQDMVERLEKRKENLLREIDKLKSDKGSRTRLGSNLGKRENSNPIRQSITSLIAQNISFEEFTKEKYSREITGSTTPSSNAEDTSPRPLRTRNYNGGRPVSPLIRRSESRNKYERKDPQ